MRSLTTIINKLKEKRMPFTKSYSYKPKRIKKAKIPVTVANITTEQLHTLRAELALLAEPWKKQGVRILVGKKVA